MIFLPLPLANYAQLLSAQQFLKTIKPYAPVQADSGRETWFEGSGVFMCGDELTWSRVWDRHIKNESIGNQKVGNLNPAPTIDFHMNVIVAMFAGPTRGIVGYRVLNGFLLGKDAFVRLVPVPSNSSTNNIALPSPWAFLVLPRGNVDVSIQMPQGNQWKTVAKVKPAF